MSRYTFNLALVLSFTLALQLASGGPAVYSNMTANASLQSYLGSYGVSNAVISGSSYYSIKYNGSEFIVVNETSGHDLLLQLIPGNYSFVLSSPLAYSVMRPYLIARSFPGNSTLAYLNSTMRSFINASSGPLNTCLEATGIHDEVTGASYVCSSNISLSSLTTCMQNTCQHAPLCGGTFPSKSGVKSELQNFGVPSLFAYGVQNLSIQYSALNASYKSYFSILSGINQSNIGSELPALSSVERNISAISVELPINPVFPPPANASISYLSQTCGAYEGTLNGPWYCNAADFCNYVTFNATKLSGINSTISLLESLPLSNPVIMQRANATVADNELVYAPKALSVKFKAVASLKNATAGPYNSAVLNSSLLLSRVSSPALANALANLEIVFQPLAGINASENYSKLGGPAQTAVEAMNTITLNATFRSAIAKLQPIYRNVSAQYNSIYSRALNNTAMLLIAQLNYEGAPPHAIAALTLQEQQANTELNGRINASQMPEISNTLASISSQTSAQSSTPASLPSIVKGFDSGIIAMLQPSVIEPVSSKIQTAPAFAALISFIIGLIVLGLAYELTYARLKKNNKIKAKPSVKRAWTVVFAILFVMVLAYAYGTYALAASANTFLPTGGFLSALSQSRYASIAVNGSAASQMAPCAAQLQRILNQSGRAVQILYVQGDSCTSGSLTGAACLNNAVSKGPVVMLSAGNESSIVYRGMYGSILYVGGRAAYGASCPAASAFKKG
jgi:hypothetical protein